MTRWTPSALPAQWTWTAQLPPWVGRRAELARLEGISAAVEHGCGSSSSLRASRVRASPARDGGRLALHTHGVPVLVGARTSDFGTCHLMRRPSSHDRSSDLASTTTQNWQVIPLKNGTNQSSNMAIARSGPLGRARRSTASRASLETGSPLQVLGAEGMWQQFFEPVASHPSLLLDDDLSAAELA